MQSLETGPNLNRRLAWIRAAGVVGVLFGLLTIREGGAVLFVDGVARVEAGNFVPFVLWSNFLSGFAYLIAGIGLLFQRAWAARIALAVAIATLGVFAAFGIHIVSGEAYEVRTVVAMTLRSAVWLAIAAVARCLYQDGR